MTRTHHITRFLGATLASIALFCTILAQPAWPGPMMDEARAKANILWDSPCEGKWRMNVSADLGKDETGHNFWGYTKLKCEIWVQPPSIITPTWFCMVVLHEVGHLRFNSIFHDENPNSIMYLAFPSPTNYIHPLCKEFGFAQAAKVPKRAGGRRPDPWVHP